MSFRRGPSEGEGTMQLTKRGFGLLVLAGCMTAPATAQGLRSVTIAISSSSLVAAAPRVARQMGLFEQHGLDAKLTIMPSASAATQALIGRSVDFSLSGPGEVLAAQARGQKLALVGSAYRGLGASLVLSKAVVEKKGIKPEAPLAERLKAMDGVIIGTANATSSYTLSFKGAAASVGATPKFTYLDAAAMAAALESGAIEGFIASAPFWAKPILNGAAVMWIVGPRGELPAAHRPATSLTIVTLREYADGNAATLAAVRAAMAELSRAVDERPEAVKAAVAQIFPDLDRATLDLMVALEAPAWKMKATDAADVAAEIAFVKATGVNIPGLDTLDPSSLILKP